MDTGLKNRAHTLLHLDFVLPVNWAFSEEQIHRALVDGRTEEIACKSMKTDEHISVKLFFCGSYLFYPEDSF